ncbi:GumC family protein [Amaricoccus sp. W119]|uniref:GumC family protein n=1 Tax=Amaricoccus sp. W119 TaxID=3391833 RepID=UPI0039A45BA1
MKIAHRNDLIKPDGGSGTEEIDAAAILSSLWRNRYSVAAVVMLCVAMAFAHVKFVAEPRFSATSVVVLESRETEVIGLESVLGGLGRDSSVVKTEVEVLRGRTLMGRVADELSLAEDPEFNSALRPKGPVARAKEFVFGAKPTQTDPRRRRDRVVSALLGSVTISNVPQSLVFQIAVESGSAEKSAKIADTIARLYIDDQVQVKFDATQRAAEWLSGQVADLKAELEDAEEAIRKFQSETSVIDATVLSALDRQLKDTRERRAATEERAANLAAQREALEQATTADAATAVFDEPQLNDLAFDAAQGGAEAALAYEARLDYLERRLDHDLRRLRGQAGSLAAAELTLAADIERQSQELIELDQMVREAEAGKLLYEHFQTRMKEAIAQQGIQQADSRVLSPAVRPSVPSAPRGSLILAIAQQGIQQADSRVLSPAVRPSVPSAPRGSLILAMATVLGLVLGCALVLGREIFASGIRTANDLEALTGRAVLGQVPVAPERERSKVVSYLSQNPTSAMAEAVRNLRTSILLSDIDKAPRTIAVTSSVPGEGKTTLSLALAQNLSMMGKKVLLIEGDIRRRTFKRHLKLSGKRGLVAALSGAARIEDVAQPVPGLGDVILGEKAPTNAADLFSSEAFSRLLAEARKSYDIILVDTPPVLVVPDARVIAPHVDATVFVVHWDRTSTVQVQEGLRMLDMPNIRVAGLVLSQIDPGRMRRYGYGDRYGAYAAYGSKYYVAG